MLRQQRDSNPFASSNRRGLARFVRAAALAGAVALLAACGAKNAGDQPVAVSVEAARVERATIRRLVKAQAILYPLHQATIVPKISAPVSRFTVNRGDAVHAGELLAELENRDLAAAMEETQGAYEQAQAAYDTTTQASLPAEIQKAELDAESARQSMEAEQRLFESRQKLYQQGALARKDLDQSRVSLTQARNAYEMAQAHLKALNAGGKAQALKSAEGQLAAARGHYMDAKARFDYSKIYSPIDGVVTDRPLYPGEMASAGSPLITIMDLSSVIARAHVTASEAAFLKVGDAATLAGEGGVLQASGKVTIVSPALDPSSSTVEVWVQAPNPGGRFKPGSAVTVTMVAETVPGALVIPAAAILQAPDGSSSVMVIDDKNHAHARGIKTGIREDDRVQVTDGLAAGQPIVTVGAFGLPDDTLVRIIQPKG